MTHFYKIVFTLFVKLYLINAQCNVNQTNWLGDGVCDKQNGYNTPECNYDEGDCCRSSCINTPNVKCEDNDFNCIDPNFPDKDNAHIQVKISTYSENINCEDDVKVIFQDMYKCNENDVFENGVGYVFKECTEDIVTYDTYYEVGCSNVYFKNIQYATHTCHPMNGGSLKIECIGLSSGSLTPIPTDNNGDICNKNNPCGKRLRVFQIVGIVCGSLAGIAACLLCTFRGPCKKIICKGDNDEDEDEDDNNNNNLIN